MSERIPFNRPHMTGRELHHISQAHFQGRLSGDGEFTARCHRWLQDNVGTQRALLTNSCTAALEMSALLADIQPGDEVIMPSYTFVSTANAFALRGGVPVFVDIRSDTLNLDESLLEQALTEKTRAIVPVHYAGVACEMDAILAFAQRHGLMVIEDAAQGVGARYRGIALGAIGDLGTYSFHETKNIISGEGGALLVNRDELADRAEIIREKGTDRSRFFRGQVDKYTWQDTGSSYLPGELVAAFLFAQLEAATEITTARRSLWQAYHDLLGPLESAGQLRRPRVPEGCEHNGHLYYVLLESEAVRAAVIRQLSAEGIDAVFHYVPLHSSPAGSRLCRTATTMDNTDDLSSRLLRLPLWMGMESGQIERVVASLTSILAAQ